MPQVDAKKLRRDLGEWEGNRELAKRAVAYLAGGGDFNKRYTQKQIADLMKISPTTIHRLLDECLKSDPPLLSKTTIHHLRHDEVATVRHRLFPSRVYALLNDFCITQKCPDVKSVDIVSGLNEPDLPSDVNEQDRNVRRWEKRMVEFGEKIAPIMRDLILKARILGVTSRYTMFWMLKGLQKLSSESKQRNLPWPTADVEFIPLWGLAFKHSEKQAASDSNWINHEQLSASVICAGLNDIFNGGNKQSRSIDGFPGILPLKWEEERINRFMEDLCDLSQAYLEIFGSERNAQQNQEPLINQMDGALVPVGTPLHPTRFWSGDYMEQAGFTERDRKMFCECLHGDIGGIPLPKQVGFSKKIMEQCQALIAKVKRCWLSVKANHLMECVSRSQESGGLGVVVLACGIERSRIVLEGIKKGLINRLVIDDECARGIEMEIEQTGKDSVWHSPTGA